MSVPSGALYDSFALALYITVLEDITGATAFDVGVGGSSGMFGQDVPVASGSSHWVRAFSPIEMFWGADIPILLTAKGGDFTGGKVRITAYALGLTAPSAS